MSSDKTSIVQQGPVFPQYGLNSFNLRPQQMLDEQLQNLDEKSEIPNNPTFTNNLHNPRTSFVLSEYDQELDNLGVTDSTLNVGNRKRIIQSRVSWSSEEDLMLVQQVIKHKDLLRDPKFSKPRKTFWDSIRRFLQDEHGIKRNTRQCRDRFNLLFTKAIRNYHNHCHPKNELDGLCLNLNKIFRMDFDNNIVLIDESNSATATPPVEQTTPFPNSAYSMASETDSSEAKELDSEQMQVSQLFSTITTLKQQVSDLTQTLADLTNIANVQQLHIRMLLASEHPSFQPQPQPQPQLQPPFPPTSKHMQAIPTESNLQMYYNYGIPPNISPSQHGMNGVQAYSLKDTSAINTPPSIVDDTNNDSSMLNINLRKPSYSEFPPPQAQQPPL